MALFKDFLTARGQRMLAGMLAGEVANLEFTRVVLGDGENKNPEGTTEVVSPICEAEIESVVLNDNNVLSITATFDNVHIESGFYMREKGIYLSDGKEEVLAVYANAGTTASYIEPAASGVIKKVIRSSIAFSQADSVNITLSDGTYANAEDFKGHTINKENPHDVTKEQLGLGNVDNTSDLDKPVSTAQQEALDLAYQQANLYTDEKINYLVNGAPTTLDTLKEVADAIQENESVAKALDAAIGTKAGQVELDTHTGNSTIHTNATERTNWNDANAKKHTHSNKTVLDNTTASYTTAEKSKLEGIATGANKITVDTALSSTSTNPVQNKIIHESIKELLSMVAHLLKNSGNLISATVTNLNNTELGGSIYYACIPESTAKANIGKTVLIFFNNGAIGKTEISTGYVISPSIEWLTSATVPYVNKTDIQAGTNTLAVNSAGGAYTIAAGYGYGAVLELSKTNSLSTKFFIVEV